MQEANTTSTLELVVNEQQMQNMSQIDLSNPNGQTDNNRTTQHGSQGFNIKQLGEWPTRFRESFGSKIDEARSKSETNCQFVLEVLRAFSSIVIWALCFICTIIIPFFLLMIGLLNLDNCLGRPSLPYLVFITGFIMTASNLFNLAISLDLPVLSNHQILTSDIKNTIASIVNIIFNCVVAILYILCAYMVYAFTANGYSDEIVCGGLLYNFTFWFVTLTLSTSVVLVLIAAVFFAYNKYRLAILRGSTPRSQTNTDQPSTFATNGV